MRFRQSALIFAFLIFGFTACSGGGVTAPPTAGSTASFGTMATVDTAQSIAEGHASSFAQARDNDDGITVKPKRLQFDSVSASPQTVTVSVKEKTTVYAASRDSHVAAVSPSQQASGENGGTLTYTITPHRDDEHKTDVCFVTREWRYACVAVSIGKGGPPQISFNPQSPLQLAPLVVQTIAVSEANYSGGFSLASCSASSGGTCTILLDSTGHNEGDCYNGTALSHNNMTFSQNTATSFNALSGPSGTGVAALNCTFTVLDQNGHQADYIVELPAI